MSNFGHLLLPQNVNYADVWIDNITSLMNKLAVLFNGPYSIYFGCADKKVPHWEVPF